MNTAQEFAKFAIEAGQMAEKIKPVDGDLYANARKLAQYHLNSAASQARQIAEALAKKENPTA